MFCGKCGTSNSDGAQFCGNCGAALSAAQAGAPMWPGPDGPPIQPYVGPTGISGKAIGSLICGLFFFMFPAAVVAIILGHLSLSDIRKAAGRLTGRGIAVAGLVLGYFGVAFIPFILIIAAIAIPNLLRARTAANEASAAGSLRTINSADILYLSTYDNGYAPALETLDGGSAGVADCNHAQLIDTRLATGLKNGYRFSYAPVFENYQAQSRVSPEAAAKGCITPGVSKYTVHADPVVRGTTGQRSFFTDQSGVIRWEMEGEASADSPPLE
jgi:type II secretory pathway pseudopilin PulG